MEQTVTYTEKLYRGTYWTYRRVLLQSYDQVTAHPWFHINVNSSSSGFGLLIKQHKMYSYSIQLFVEIMKRKKKLSSRNNNHLIDWKWKQALKHFMLPVLPGAFQSEPWKQKIWVWSVGREVAWPQQRFEITECNTFVLKGFHEPQGHET